MKQCWFQVVRAESVVGLDRRLVQHTRPHTKLVERTTEACITRPHRLANPRVGSTRWQRRDRPASDIDAVHIERRGLTRSSVKHHHDVCMVEVVECCWACGGIPCRTINHSKMNIASRWLTVHYHRIIIVAIITKLKQTRATTSIRVRRARPQLHTHLPRPFHDIRPEIHIRFIRDRVALELHCTIRHIDIGWWSVDSGIFTVCERIGRCVYNRRAARHLIERIPMKQCRCGSDVSKKWSLQSDQQDCGGQDKLQKYSHYFIW